MEILFVSHKYPPATGGMEKQSYELITRMEKYCTVHKIVYEGQENRIQFFLQLQKRIVKMLKKHPNIKAIHLNDGLLAAICSFHTQYKAIPVVVTVHGLEVSFPNKLYKNYILPRLNRYAKIIAVSTATGQAVVNNGIQASKVVVIPNGVDITEQTHTSFAEFENLRKSLGLSNKKILLMLGRPVARKGFSWFVENVLPKINHDYQVVLVGPFEKEPTPFEKRLKFLPENIRHQIMLFLGYPSDQARLREVLKNFSDVTHLGHQPYSVIQALFKYAEAFIMPNISVNGDMEGFGLVCLEASINGALVLAANIDGIPSAIQHQKNGLLIESGNAEAWANTLMQLQNFSISKEKFTQFTLQNYSWDIMVKEYYKLFESL